MNRITILISGVLIVAIIVALNWTLFLPPGQYFRTIFDLDIPHAATNVHTYRTGSNTPRVEFALPKRDFQIFKETTEKKGYIPWKLQPYDVHDGTTILQMVTIAGFGMSETGQLEICQIARTKGNTFTLIYDYNTKMFMAIKSAN